MSRSKFKIFSLSSLFLGAALTVVGIASKHRWLILPGMTGLGTGATLAYKARKIEDKAEGSDNQQISIPSSSDIVQDSAVENDLSAQEAIFEIPQSRTFSEDLEIFPTEALPHQETITQIENSPVETSAPPHETKQVQAESGNILEIDSPTIEEIEQPPISEDANIREITSEQDQRSNSVTSTSDPECSLKNPKIVCKDGKILLDLRSKDRDASDLVPMMFRAQSKGRCSLQYISSPKDFKKTDLSEWRKELLLPHDRSSSRNNNDQQPGVDQENRQFKVKFPFRLFSNSGQDSILRPVFKNGIPFIPGSSIKGIFRRACNDIDEELATLYCGDEKKPGILRFHGTYPTDETWKERIIDVCHPQEKKQLGIRQSEEDEGAKALVSLYQPEMIFEFSSESTEIDWEQVEAILQKALNKGIGGKTSSGYGLGGYVENHEFDTSDCSYPIKLNLKGIGVNSKLLTGESEFRQNLFKAVLRGHTNRLLGGVCASEKVVTSIVNRLFGSVENPAIVRIFWNSSNADSNAYTTPIYNVEGILHLAAASKDDLDFVGNVLKFSYVMGGFGKSWRRIWHKKFFKNYQKQFSIGCHWESTNIWEPSNVKVICSATLKQFLDTLYQECKMYCCIRSHPGRLSSWRESWNPECVSVFSAITTESKAVHLFHDNHFKLTPAIGGRTQEGAPTYTSSVWHRMLPVDADSEGKHQYLEIVTLFHQLREPWNTNLCLFTEALETNGLHHTWGKSKTELNCEQKDVEKNPRPKPRKQKNIPT
jgi:CRISPR-associated protein Cmr6